MNEKRCNICQHWYPSTREYFNSKTTSADGLTKACSICLAKKYALKPPKECLPAPEKATRFSRLRVNEDGSRDLWCSGCKAYHPASAEVYAVNQASVHGLHFYCKIFEKCQKAIRREATKVEREQAIQARREKRKRETAAKAQARRKEPLRKRKSTLAEETQLLERQCKRKCTICKEIYPLDWAYFGTSRTELGKYCYLCRRTQHKGAEFLPIAREELHIRCTPELLAAKEKQREARARAQDREKEKRYRQSPKGRRRGNIKNHKKRMRLRELPFSFTSAQWDTCLDYFDHRCAVCGEQETFFTVLAQDHWIAVTDPRPDNPGTVATNIVPLCHSTAEGMRGCNNLKGNQGAHEWLVDTFGAQKARRIEARIQAYFKWVRVQNEAALRSWGTRRRFLPQERKGSRWLTLSIHVFAKPAK